MSEPTKARIQELEGIIKDTWQDAILEFDYYQYDNWIEEGLMTIEELDWLRDNVNIEIKVRW